MQEQALVGLVDFHDGPGTMERDGTVSWLLLDKLTLAQGPIKNVWQLCALFFLPSAFLYSQVHKSFRLAQFAFQAKYFSVIFFFPKLAVNTINLCRRQGANSSKATIGLLRDLCILLSKRFSSLTDGIKKTQGRIKRKFAFHLRAFLPGQGLHQRWNVNQGCSWWLPRRPAFLECGVNLRES